jgi:hypothetical protein
MNEGVILKNYGIKDKDFILMNVFGSFKSN